MKQPIVYLDTSFFIGLLENVANRRQPAKEVLLYETSQSSKLYTSLLTINEYTVKYYDKYRHQSDCDKLVEEVITNIRDIATIYAITVEIAKESARLMSVWSAHRKLNQPSLPRDRKFRWDSLHIATAHILKADRVYAFDDHWNDFPKSEIPNIQKIISPAQSPQAQLTMLSPPSSSTI